MKTKVIFRTFRKGGDTLAMFPEIPADAMGDFCQSYQHVGQHGAASPSLPGVTRPATPEETAPLRRELEAIGYALEPRAKVSFAMHKARREEARRLRTVPA